MEIDMDDLDPMATQQTTMELGLLPEGKSLESELGAKTYEKIAGHAKDMGLDPALLNRFRPWLAALTLVQLQLMKMGLDPNSGIEQRLTSRATADGKEITGLETLQQQLGMLANLSPTLQREFLQDGLIDFAQTELVRPIGIIHRRQKLLTPITGKLIEFLQNVER
jgi:hypothetical protein